MIRHAMDMVKQAVDILNPGQVPIITVVQTLYTVAKQIQWSWPSTHGESHFIVMIGGFHITQIKCSHPTSCLSYIMSTEWMSCGMNISPIVLRLKHAAREERVFGDAFSHPVPYLELARVPSY